MTRTSYEEVITNQHREDNDMRKKWREPHDLIALPNIAPNILKIKVVEIMAEGWFP